jgi:hypothetical protein
MKQGIEAMLDGETLVVRIPMRFQRRGGRKRIVAPDGSQIMPASKPSQTARWSRRWRGGGAGNGCSRAACTPRSPRSLRPRRSKSYISRILRLAQLAPDIVEIVLEGRANQALMLGRLERSLPAGWEEQRRLLSAHTS